MSPTPLAPTTPAPLDYFSPKPAKAWLRETTPILALIVGFVTAEGCISFVSNFILRQYNGYLGWDLCFAIDVMTAIVMGTLAAVLIAIAAFNLKRVLPRLRFPGKCFMFVFGLTHGILSRTPPVIDIATSSGRFDSSENLESNGWGYGLAFIFFSTLPLLLILLMLIFSLNTRRKSAAAAQVGAPFSA